MEVLGRTEPERAVRRRDVELPGQRGRAPERLLVEEVPPSPDCLAENDAGCRDVEATQDGQAPQRGQPHAHQYSDDEPAMDGEAAFPHREDLPRMLAVVIPVEDDLVESRS